MPWVLRRRRGASGVLFTGSAPSGDLRWRVPRHAPSGHDEATLSTNVSSGRKTAHIRSISGCTTSLIRETRPIRGKKIATPNEFHSLHNHHAEIPGGTNRSR